MEYLLPSEIERRSFEIIAAELEQRHMVLAPDEAPVTKRVIHTTADFDYASTMSYSEDAVEKAVALLQSGADIVTDTNMGRAGIHKSTLKKLGGEVHCWMADPAVAQEAKARGITRAAVSMERAAALPGPVIIAVGNAPTALISLYEIAQRTGWQPAFLIGVPVGFVNVEEAKELWLDSAVPHIINRGQKGGSNVAAAICNALIYLAAGRTV